MTNLALLPIIFFWFAMACLACWLSIWMVKANWARGCMIALFISALSMACIYSWDTLDSLTGWPSYSELPAKFRVLGIRVDHPTKESKGAIYLWTNDSQDMRPRGFGLDYSKSGAAAANKVQQMLRKGKVVIAEATKKRGFKLGKGKGKGGGRKKGKGKNGGRPGSGRVTFENGTWEMILYELPPVNLLPKDPPNAH